LTTRAQYSETKIFQQKQKFKKENVAGHTQEAVETTSQEYSSFNYFFLFAHKLSGNNSTKLEIRQVTRLVNLIRHASLKQCERNCHRLLATRGN
jgi:hypothetical protein